MQACRFRGSASSADLSVGFVAIAERSTGKVQIVDVDTATRKEKQRLQSLGLDLTEHGDANSVEVVLHGAADERKLRDAGFTYDVRIADLEARSKADKTADAKFAASNPKTQLPSGSNQYRHLADYNLELKQLAMRYPGLVKELTLNHPSRSRAATSTASRSRRTRPRRTASRSSCSSASTTRVSGRRRSTRSSSRTTC